LHAQHAVAALVGGVPWLIGQHHSCKDVRYMTTGLGEIAPFPAEGQERVIADAVRSRQLSSGDRTWPTSESGGSGVISLGRWTTTSRRS
jgi:hypothetical protein